MLTTTIDSGKSRGGSNDLQSSAQADPQVIQEYRERYLQIAWKVQGLMSMIPTTSFIGSVVNTSL